MHTFGFLGDRMMMMMMSKIDNKQGRKRKMVNGMDGMMEIMEITYRWQDIDL